MVKIAFCTVITENHLGYCDTLYESLVQHNEVNDFFALVVDSTKSSFCTKHSDLSYKVLFAEDFISDRIEKMRKYYSNFELCSAAKPELIAHVLKNCDCELAIYLDSDIFVTGSFMHVAEVLRDKVFSFTPHLVSGGKHIKSNVPLTDIINLGIYNGGFYAFKNCKQSFEILQELCNLLESDGFNFELINQFVDQKYLAHLSLLYAKYFAPIKAKSFNIAYWNLHERQIEFKKDKFYVNGQEIVFFHFSGFNPAIPNQLTSFGNQYDGLIENNLHIKEVLKKYHSNLSANLVKRNYSKSKEPLSILQRRFRQKYRRELKKSNPYFWLLKFLYHTYVYIEIFFKKRF